jgi:1,4-alpha-glucan branching enzyme
VLNSDATSFGGSGYAVADTMEAELVPYHGFPQSVTVSLPPLSMLVLLPAQQPAVRAVIDLLADRAARDVRQPRDADTPAPKPEKPTKTSKRLKAPKEPKEPKEPKREKPVKAS